MVVVRFVRHKLYVGDVRIGLPNEEVGFRIFAFSAEALERELMHATRAPILWSTLNVSPDLLKPTYESAMKESIRIASGQGFWGDLQTAPLQQVSRGPIDYLVMDYLAEVTMSILQKQRMKNPDLGYARDLIDVCDDVLPYIASVASSSSPMAVVLTPWLLAMRSSKRHVRRGSRGSRLV